MTRIRKSMAFARTAVAAFFKADRQPVLDASELDHYLLDRETRMGTVWNFVADWPEPKREIQPGLKCRTEEFNACQGSFMVAPFASQQHTQSRAHSKTTVPASPSSRRKLGLAFGGGFARAIAHISVLNVLEGEKIPVDSVAGTSAGAILDAA